MGRDAPPFAQQLLVLLALVLGMTMYIIAVAVVLHANDGKPLAEAPNPLLDTVCVATGGGLALTAMLLRTILRARAAKLTGGERASLWFKSNLAAIALLEGGSLFGSTTWLLNGNAVPGLVVALVLLSLAIAIVPFTDPDVGRR